MAVPYLQQNASTYDPRTASSYAAISGVSDAGLQMIQNSQREHPEYYPKNYKMAFDTFLTNVENRENPNAPPVVQQPHSAVGASQSKVKPTTIDYFNADIAKKYGMNKSTAYQEAMSNTAYQRAVKDMQAAGLNPAVLFGGNRATPANSAVYAADQSSGGFGRSFGGRSGSSDDSKLFSGSAYSFLQAVGGLVGIATTKRPDGFWIGSQVAKGAMGLLDAVFK